MRSPKNTLPSHFQAHHRAHQPIKGPPSEAQKSKRRQAGTRTEDSEEGTLCPGHFQAGPRRPSDPVFKHESHQEQSRGEVLQNTFQTSEGCCLGVWDPL